MNDTPIRAISNVVFFQGYLDRVFPAGDYIFTARAGDQKELGHAIEQSAYEVHHVPLTAPAAGQRDPLVLSGLCALIERRWPAVVDSAGTLLAESACTYARERIGELTALGAPAVLRTASEAWLEEVSQPGWRPVLDLAELLPDAVACAAIVDVAKWQAAGRPLEVDADVSQIVLLATLCCLGSQSVALDIEASVVEQLDWTSLLPTPAEAAVEPESIAVKPSISWEKVERLEFAAVSGSLATELLKNVETLLRVSIPQSE